MPKFRTLPTSVALPVLSRRFIISNTSQRSYPYPQCNCPFSEFRRPTHLSDIQASSYNPRSRMQSLPSIQIMYGFCKLCSVPTASWTGSNIWSFGPSACSCLHGVCLDRWITRISHAPACRRWRVVFVNNVTLRVRAFFFYRQLCTDARTCFPARIMIHCFS